LICLKPTELRRSLMDLTAWNGVGEALTKSRKSLAAALMFTGAIVESFLICRRCSMCRTGDEESDRGGLARRLGARDSKWATPNRGRLKVARLPIRSGEGRKGQLLDAWPELRVRLLEISSGRALQTPIRETGSLSNHCLARKHFSNMSESPTLRLPQSAMHNAHDGRLLAARHNATRFCGYKLARSF
jgi:hypothetical protein